MQTLLLTGASGFLGKYFIAAYKDKYNIIGIVNSNTNSSIATHCLDISDTTALANLINEIKPTAILHTAAISSIAACQADVTKSEATNVKASVQLAKLAAQLGAQFIFTSTDLVFDGIKGNYTETDLPNPLNIYGQQKWEAEKEIIAANPTSLIVRLPLMIGENSMSNVGVIADLRNIATAGNSANLFTDEYRTPLHVQEVSKAIDFLIDKKAKGVYHIAGIKKYSRHQLGLFIKEKYNLKNLSITATTHAACNITNRPKDVSMNIDKLLQLGFLPNNDL